MIPKYPPPFVIHETCLASFSFGVSAKTDFKGNDCPDKIFQAKIRNNFLFYFGIRNSLDIFFQHKLVRLTRPHSPLGGGNNCSQKCGLNSITRYIRNNNTVSFWVKSNLVKLEASYTAILPYCACSLDQLMNTNIMNTNTMN